MQTTNCPYIKIPSKTLATNYTSNSFSLIPTANAQSATTQAPDIATSLSNQLTIPFFLIIFSFFIFVILMSSVYIYHWHKFSLDDPFIKNFTPVYFFGLVLLSIPLIFNLFF